MLYKTYKNKYLGEIVRTPATVIFLLLFAVATLFPIYFMIISAFAPPVEAGAVSYDIIPLYALWVDHRGICSNGKSRDRRRI